MLGSPAMDDVRTTLEACRRDAGARLAALVGIDGLVIDDARDPTADAATGGPIDLALAAAEATDLWTVADRLHRTGVGAPPVRDVRTSGDDATVLLRRLRGDAFVMLVAPGADSDAAREALDRASPRLEEALA